MNLREFPTWNYQAVHIEGTAQSFTDSKKLKHVVDTLTAANEAACQNPWEPDYSASMLHGIVETCEIAITSIQCKFKRSQNRSLQDQSDVQEQFAHSGYKALATAMNKS